MAVEQIHFNVSKIVLTIDHWLWIKPGASRVDMTMDMLGAKLLWSLSKVENRRVELCDGSLLNKAYENCSCGVNHFQGKHLIFQCCIAGLVLGCTQLLKEAEEEKAKSDSKGDTATGSEAGIKAVPRKRTLQVADMYIYIYIDSIANLYMYTVFTYAQYITGYPYKLYIKRMIPREKNWQRNNDVPALILTWPRKIGHPKRKGVQTFYK